MGLIRTDTDEYILSFRTKQNPKTKRGWKTRWRDFRRSKKLVAMAFFLAVFTDCSALTLVQSLAPAIIKSMEYEPCNCSEIVKTSGSLTSSNTSTAKPEEFCMIGEQEPCHNNTEIMRAIAGTVGVFGAVGPLAELLANPVIAYVCTKVGHRTPFLFGAVVQIMGSFLLMFARTEIMLFGGRLTQALASTTVSISGLLMVTDFFTDEREKSQVLAVCYASAFPMAAIVNYPLGNGGYQLFGSYLPFGLLAGVSIVDGLIRVILDTEKVDMGNQGDREDSPDIGDDSESTIMVKRAPENYGSIAEEVSPSAEITINQKSGGSYLEVLTDAHVMVLITITFVQCFAYFCVGSTAPNWVVNIINAEQWQLGVVLGVCGFGQLIANVIIGQTAKRKFLWLIISGGHLLLFGGLVSYTFSPTIWWTIVPEMACRLAAGIVFGVVSNMLSCAIETKGPANMARGFSLFVAAYTLAAAAGPFVGGILLEHIFMRLLYFSLAGAVVLSGLLSLYMHSLKL